MNSNTSPLRDELNEAAKDFYNLTIGDARVHIKAFSNESRDAIVKAGERLRAAIASPPSQPIAPKSSAFHAAVAKVAAMTDGEISRAIASQPIASDVVAAPRCPHGWTLGTKECAACEALSRHGSVEAESHRSPRNTERRQLIPRAPHDRRKPCSRCGSRRWTECGMGGCPQ